MTAFRPLTAALAISAVLPLMLDGCRSRVPAARPASETPAPTTIAGRLVLFFPGNDALLHRESREVPELPPAALARIRLVVEELAAGSRDGFSSPFPWAATVQAVFLDRGGSAFIDLSAPPPDAVPGSDGELALAYATTNSVVANCPGVERVQLLFGGRQVATLGHLDFSRPFRPKLELVAP